MEQKNHLEMETKEKCTEEFNRNHFVFLKIEKMLMEETEPSKKLNEYSKTDEFKQSVFHMLNRMKSTEQSKQHHPEGNVWIHTMMVVDEAAKLRDKSKDQRVFMWSAMLHDIGKPEVTRVRKGKITAYNHDKVGAVATKEILSKACKDLTFIERVSAMVRWHMQILFIAKNMAFADIAAMKNEVDVEEVALLGMCDRLGRLGVKREDVMRDISKFQQMIGTT